MDDREFAEGLYLRVATWEAWAFRAHRARSEGAVDEAQWMQAYADAAETAVDVWRFAYTAELARRHAVLLGLPVAREGARQGLESELALHAHALATAGTAVRAYEALVAEGHAAPPLRPTSPDLMLVAGWHRYRARHVEDSELRMLTLAVPDTVPARQWKVVLAHVRSKVQAAERAHETDGRDAGGHRLKSFSFDDARGLPTLREPTLSAAQRIDIAWQGLVGAGLKKDVRSLWKFAHPGGAALAVAGLWGVRATHALAHAAGWEAVALKQAPDSSIRRQMQATADAFREAAKELVRHNLTPFATREALKQVAGIAHDIPADVVGKLVGSIAENAAQVSGLMAAVPAQPMTRVQQEARAYVRWFMTNKLPRGAFDAEQQTAVVDALRTGCADAAKGLIGLAVQACSATPPAAVAQPLEAPVEAVCALLEDGASRFTALYAAGIAPRVETLLRRDGAGEERLADALGAMPRSPHVDVVPPSPPRTPPVRAVPSGITPKVMARRPPPQRNMTLPDGLS